MKHFSTAFLAVCAILFGCKEYPCTEAVTNIAFISFPVDETDTILVKKYEKASNFTILIESFSINQTNSNYCRYNDTLQVSYSFGLDNGFLSKYDYKIELPKVNRQYLITEITEEYRSIRTGLSMDKIGCINFIKSYQVNGQVISGANNYYTFYFKK
ncbi:MAG: hypothetical protein K2P88_07290 [Chitinophagaceae bacterium]|uniref:hypothetical protein n=1 Tax=unclassified Paraflavitalea TaxID=2798305 RepID=UPI003D32F517|nr:hypothetical protein [Chitinophagaceae bacterium]